MSPNNSIITLFLIVSLLVVPNINNGQNVDSLLSIWQQKELKHSTRLDAIQAVLTNNSYVKTRLDTASQLALEQYNLAKNSENVSQIIDALNNRSLFAINQQRYLDALDLVDEGLNLEGKDLYPIKVSDLLIIKGISLSKIGREREAIATYKKVFLLDNLQKSIISDTYNSMAISFSRIGKYSEALDAYQKSYELIENSEKENCDKALYYNNISCVFFKMARYETAGQNFKKALTYQLKCGDEKGLIIKYANLAEVYLIQKEYEKALINYDSSLVLALKYNKKVLAIDNRVGIANIYIEQNLLDEAEKILMDVDSLIPKIEDYKSRGEYFYAYGKLKEKKKLYKEGFEACQKGYRIFSTHFFSAGTEKCARCLYEISEHQQDYKKAIEWLIIATTLKDSIANKNTLLKLAQLESELTYQEEKAIFENNILSLKLEKEEEQKDKLYLSFFLITATTIGLSFIWVYFSEKKKKNILQKQNTILAENLENKKLIEAQATKLREQEMRKYNFIANLAHEFQTPLTIINGQSNTLLTEKGFSTKIKQTIEAITRNSFSLSKLTSQILEVTKNKDWKIEINVNEFLLYELLNPIIEEYKILTKDKQIQFKFNYNETQELLLKTDAYKLKIIIVNLLSNAIKYSKTSGSVTVNCRTQGEKLEIEVKDNGVGISEQDLPNVFDRFYQARQGEDFEQNKGGVGVGLAICQEYITMLQGDITVESTKNEGSIFNILVPTRLKEGFPITQAKILKPFLKNTQISDSIPDTIKISDTTETILVVEDNKDIWFYLQNIFKDKYNLIFKSNGLEALSFLENSPAPNIIISDVMMPQMDGITFVKTLKQDTRFNRIPLMILTARNDLKNILKELRLNMDDYIIKPFDNTIFSSRIEYLLKLSKEQQLESQHKEILLNKKNQAWLEKVEQYVINSLGDHDLKPKKIAEVMNLSEVHFNRKLKALTGFTASKYILEARFRTSFKLLEQQEVSSVKAACYAVGFKQPGYFSKSFKERFGKSPSDLL